MTFYIEVDIINIIWMENCPSKNILENPLIFRDLRKPFKLGEEKVVKLNKLQFSYKICHVFTKNEEYELLSNGNIKVTNIHSKESNELDEILDFKTFCLTKYNIPKQNEKELKVLGFDEIQNQIVRLHLNQPEFSMCVIHGPDGSGKKLFLKKLEQNYKNRIFLWINSDNLESRKGYMEKVFLNLRLYDRNVILCIVDGHLIKNNSKFNKELYKLRNEFHFKVIVTCTHLGALDEELRSLRDGDYFVKPLNHLDKMKLLQEIITSFTGREVAEEGLDLFATTLHGYTPSDIYTFVNLIHIDHPTLLLEQLYEAKKLKLYTPQNLMNLNTDINPLLWSQIGGYEHIKEHLIQDIQEPLLCGGVVPKGVILYGPPGCSKTMFARALATECSLNLFIVRPSNILASIVGESESNLKNILQTATNSAPSIVFIDEIDLLLPHGKMQNESPVTTRLLSELLTFMDGIVTKEDNPVIVMAATNKIEDVDEALIRSGRMDLILKIDFPDEKSIKAILNIAFLDENFIVDNEVILKIPEMSKFFVQKSGAFIVHIVNEIKKVSYKEFDLYEHSADDLPFLSMAHVNDVLYFLGN